MKTLELKRPVTELERRGAQAMLAWVALSLEQLIEVYETSSLELAGEMTYDGLAGLQGQTGARMYVMSIRAMAAMATTSNIRELMNEWGKLTTCMAMTERVARLVGKEEIEDTAEWLTNTKMATVDVKARMDELAPVEHRRVQGLYEKLQELLAADKAEVAGTVETQDVDIDEMFKAVLNRVESKDVKIEKLVMVPGGEA